MPLATSRVAVVLHMLDECLWSEAVRHDIEAVIAEHPQVQVEFADPRGVATEQTRILHRYLEEKVDAIILLPIDPEQTRATLLKYRDSGIPVVLIDNDIGSPDLYRSLVANDNRRIGREVGEFFVEVMGGVGDLVEVRGLVKTTAAIDRSTGLREVLSEHAGMRLIDSCVGEWRRDLAKKEFGSVLARQSRIDGVFAQNDDMARGVLDAAGLVDRTGEMLVVGIDAVPSAIHLVTEGRQAATFFNPSPGKHATHALLAILNDETCLPRVLLHTWPYRSNRRIQEWQNGRSPAPARRHVAAGELTGSSRGMRSSG